MKAKTYILTLAGAIGLTLSGFSQTSEPAGAQDATATPPAVVQATDVQPAPADAQPAPADTTAADPAAATAETDPTADLPAIEIDQDGAVAADEDTAPVIPLIVMDEVPLTDAIRNLARQANLNYMLDPKINFGQPGAADGRSVPQPLVSLRWEKVTAQAALTALLGNYNLQLKEDPKTKITRVTAKDPTAPDPLVSRVYQLKWASPTNMLENITATFTDKRSRAVADIRTSQIVIMSTEVEHAQIKKLIEQLDTPTKQVLIEARLVETSMNPETIKGVDWSGTLTAQNVKFGNNLQANPPTTSVNNTLASTGPKLLFDTAKGFNPATAFLDADGVSAVLSFINKYSEAKVLSAPRTVTLDNETAHISVTRASPIFKNTAGTQGSPGGSEVTYTNLGVILEVTPRISANDYVNLHVVPEVSRVFDTVEKVVSSTVNQADRYDVRRINTRVMIPSGNTLVLGGLVQDDIRSKSSKVPILGDIPGIGLAFRSDSKSRGKANLMVFITPTIVQDTDFNPAHTTFLKNTPPPEDQLEPDWSAWDSGKPKDWKKKKAPAKSDEAAAEVSGNQ